MSRSTEPEGALDPDSVGCAGRRDGRQYVCISEPVLTVKYEPAGPRRRVIRVFVCEAHAVGQPDPRPLTPADRADLRRRRARRYGPQTTHKPENLA